MQCSELLFLPTISHWLVTDNDPRGWTILICPGLTFEVFGIPDGGNSGGS
jgi:hypothetical protein